MICRRCHRRFRAQAGGVCPFCGESNPPVSSGVLKTSTILISEGRNDAVYRSVSEVPPPLRRRLLKSTSGINAETILIADRRGKEELAKAIRRLPGSARHKLIETVLGGPAESAVIRFLKQWRRIVFGCLVTVLISFVIWFVRAHR
jgi:hypothetical protein